MSDLNIAFSIPLDPVPASRPRVSKWGTYYPARYRNYLKAAKDEVKKWASENLKAPLAGQLQASFQFHVKRPKTSKLECPKPDLDNYVKSVLDCLSGFVFDDDSQVRRFVQVEKHWAEPPLAPQTFIHITPYYDD